MENKIESFFRWKTNPNEISVEKKYENHKIIGQWGKTDVLYSFIGIYKVGIYAFYPDKCIKTDYTIKRKNQKFFSTNYLSTEFKKYKNLNRAIIDSEFIKYIDSEGNIIPIWPGGNVDRGGRYAYYFDIPDIYFKKYEKWFLAMKQLYPNSCLDGIIDSEFSTSDTKEFLNKMNEDRYIEFLKHIVKVITERKKYLDGLINSDLSGS